MCPFFVTYAGGNDKIHKLQQPQSFPWTISNFFRKHLLIISPFGCFYTFHADQVINPNFLFVFISGNEVESHFRLTTQSWMSFSERKYNSGGMDTGGVMIKVPILLRNRFPENALICVYKQTPFVVSTKPGSITPFQFLAHL